MLLFQNIRYALRTCVRSPGFAAVTAISLALGALRLDDTHVV